MTATNGHKACALAGRTMPTPRSTSDNDNPQRPKSSSGLLRGNKAVPCSSQTA